MTMMKSSHQPFKSRKGITFFFIRLICLSLIIYGFLNEITHPNMVKLNNSRFGGCFEFLTHIMGVSAAVIMAIGIFGDIFAIRPYFHMYLVTVILPGQIFITLVSWFFFFAFPAALKNPRAALFNAKEFDGFNNVCLHLIPCLGLLLDFITYSTYYFHHFSQGVIIFLMSISYHWWLFFLKEKNGFWTYNYISKMTNEQFYLALSTGYIISLGSWYFILPSLAKTLNASKGLADENNDLNETVEFIGRKV